MRWVSRRGPGGSGRTAIAPEILFALWLYATLEGVGSARALARAFMGNNQAALTCIYGQL